MIEEKIKSLTITQLAVIGVAIAVIAVLWYNKWAIDGLLKERNGA